MNRRFFTPREANQLLPFIQEDIANLQKTKREFVQTALRLRELRLEHERNDREPPADDVFRMEASMEFLQMEAKTLADSIRLKGAELKDVDTGLVDFPARMNGEEVLLCWRQGEERIGFYHGLEDGFRGRRPLPADAAEEDFQ
ncbi:MAG TPA: DUF2203 domain-containing protein [Paenibacillus sp.]|nr:DUF2203 domain-containing protein [Paenibacillus sp.]